ncbi:MAG: alpha/beta hydrolase [Bacteroidetes bacterium]|nr:alpha/beta hydrolase [Bacteroidota bacterium]
MSFKTVQNQELKLAYEKYGNGSTVILALHGHSKSAEDFKFLENKERTIVSIHLFHHNHSFFPNERVLSNPLKESEWAELIQELIVQENLDQFHIIGFSQGGRFALKTFETFSDRVLSLTLLSPDGIHLKGFYDRASQMKINSHLMCFFEKFPWLFYYTIKIIQKSGLVSATILDLAKGFSSSKSQMLRASKSWQNFRKIRTIPLEFGRKLQDQKIEFRLIMGKYDGIFPPKVAHQFLKQAQLEIAPIVIDCGHDFFKPNAKDMFISHLPF